MRRSDRIKEDFPEEDYPAALHAAHLLSQTRKEFYLTSWPLLLDLIHEEMATHDVGFDEATKLLLNEFQINDHNVKLTHMGKQLIEEKEKNYWPED